MSLKEKYGLNETAEILLKDGNDDPMLGADDEQCWIRVYAPGTKQHNKVRARDHNAAMDRVQKKGKQKISADELAGDEIAYAVGVTHSVSPNLAAEYPEITDQADLLEKLFGDKDIGYLLRSQVASEQRKTENFTKASTGA